MVGTRDNLLHFTLKITYPYKEIYHKEDIEGQVHLLCSTLCPGCTGFNFIPEIYIIIIIMAGLSSVMSIIIGHLAHLVAGLTEASAVPGSIPDLPTNFCRN